MKNGHLTIWQSVIGETRSQDDQRTNHQHTLSSNILKAGVLMRKTKGRGAGTHFKNEP